MPIQKADPAAKTLAVGTRYIHYGVAKGADDAAGACHLLCAPLM